MATVVIPPTASASVDLSMTDLRRMAANNWEEPAAPPAAEPTPAAAPPAPPATPAGETPPPASEPVKPAEPTEGVPPPEVDEPVTPGVQKRIDKAVKKQRDAERRVAELELRLQQPPQATPPAQPTAQPAATPSATDAAPDPAKYTDWDKYQQDLTNWTIDQRQKRDQVAHQQRTQQERGQALTQSWHASEDTARAKHADYEDVIAGVKDVPVPQHLQVAIFESQGDLSKADLAYALAKNRKELERIVALPPAQGILALGGFIANQTSPAPTPKPAAPPLPKPPSSVGGSGAAAPTVDLSTCDMRTFKREARKLCNRD